MERTLIYNITGDDLPNTVQSFLQSKGYSSQVIKELKKIPESILINATPVYMKHVLRTGETLTVNIREEESSEKIPAVPMDLNIVYEDEDILVVNKPADMPIHPSMNNYRNSLANGLAWYFETQGKPFIFRCVNRLDRDTSGLTIIAKHMLSAGILSSMVTAREIHREYLAIVSGQMTPASGTIDAPICRTADSIIERHVDYEKGERAVTHYRLKEYRNGYSLLSIHLETGRTHQIRVHMKHLGFPLIGDSLYNPLYLHLHTQSADAKPASDTSGNTDICATDFNDIDITRQALHSHRLQFTHPITGKAMDFICPLPPDMAQLLSHTRL